MTVILIHPGFHKTGTTSVQRTLQRNRKVLRPHLRVFLRSHMTPLCEAARAYSIRQDPIDLSGVVYEAAQLFEALDRDDPRPILMCSEDLSGMMPGRHKITSYGAAPHLMKTYATVAAEVLGTDTSLRFHFITRAAVPWLKSCYGQHLKATRICMTETDYVESFRNSAAFAPLIASVAESVAPHVVGQSTLEDSAKDPAGPTGAVLRRLGLDPALIGKLDIAPRANVSDPQELRDRLLALNQSDLDRDALKAAKAAARADLLGGG